MGRDRRRPAREVLPPHGTWPQAVRGAPDTLGALHEGGLNGTLGERSLHMKRIFRLPFSRDRLRRDVDTELSFHLEGRIEELVAGGMAREDAAREAQRRFGDRTQLEAEVARIDIATAQRLAVREWLYVIQQDVTFALRQLRKSPGF